MRREIRRRSPSWIAPGVLAIAALVAACSQGDARQRKEAGQAAKKEVHEATR